MLSITLQAMRRGFLCTWLIAMNVQAATNTVFNFLRNDAGARAAALGGSFLTVANDPNTIFYNPAGLSTLEKPMGSAGFFKNLLDVNSGYLSYGQSYEDWGYFGAGVTYTNYGTFDRTDELGNVLGTFSANDLSVAVGYSSTFEENLHYGAALKLIYSSLAGYTSTAVAGDLGILYRIPESRISLGASIRNLGRQISSYAGTREDLPLDVAAGVSVVPKGLPLLLNVNFHKLNEDVTSFTDRFRAFTVGGEFTLSRVLQARFGYDNEKRKDLKIGTSSGLAGFSAGIGITAKEYRFDYAISSLGKIGNLHRISIGADF
jgi:hypothetical protein